MAVKWLVTIKFGDNRRKWIVNECKSMGRLLAALMMAAWVAAAPVALAHGGDGMGQGTMGPGMAGPGMMGRGMMAPGTMGHGMMGPELELNEEQWSELGQIHGDLHREHWATMRKIMQQQSSLHELLSAQRPDPQKVEQAYDRVAKLRGQMLAAGVAALNRMRDVLTEEQRGRLDEWRHRAMAGGGMGGFQYGMGPGMMGPGMMGPGMMGPGMMGPGMMGPGMMGQGMGPGMMGPGMGQGMGPGMGQGMGPGMGQGGMAPGYGAGPGYWQNPAMPRDLTTADVERMLTNHLEWQGNPNVKLGKVEDKDENTIVAEIITNDGALVDRLEVDRRTGQVRRPN